MIDDRRLDALQELQWKPSFFALDNLWFQICTTELKGFLAVDARKNCIMSQKFPEASKRDYKVVMISCC